MTVKGTVEEIVFRNEENGYTVLLLERALSELEAKDSYGQFITVVGSFPDVHEGVMIEVEGNFKNNAKYGMQFIAVSVKFTEPDSLQGITRYLASGLIKGVRGVLALRIVEKFGADALSVIEMNPLRLSEVKGISVKKALEISESYKLTKSVQKAVMFLGKYGITLNLSLRIYSVYHDSTESVVTSNPYRMVEEVEGVGFITADKIAEKLGIGKDSEFRLRAGVRYTLTESAENGHTYLPCDELIKRSAILLNINESALTGILEALCVEARLKRITIEDREAVALPVYYHFEKTVADKLILLKNSVDNVRNIVTSEIDEFERVNRIKLHDIQRDAVVSASNEGILIITGGPGTGKTTIIKCVLSVFNSRGESTLLMAPTGRAAKRLSDTSGEEAKTVHRGLEFDPTSLSGKFNYNENKTLPYDNIIVDEVSMVDAYLMSSLVKAVKEGTRLILVGDSDQLPSVGAGNILSDLIGSGYIETIKLDRVYRQGEDSMIIENAHRINRGDMPELSGNDFFFAGTKDNEEILRNIINMTSARIPKYLNTAHSNIQILAPMKSGLCGTDNINSELQNVLNPKSVHKKEIAVGKYLFRVGDRVMHTANRYDLEWIQITETGYRREGKGVFNGDIGVIEGIDTETGEIAVRFEDNKLSSYNREASLDLMLSYAITIHKSQGSEFDVIIMPVTGGNPALLTRNLLYTAVTRAKKMVVLVGDKYYLKTMIDNNKTVERYTMLKELLHKGMKKNTLLMS